jgi:hypothetical protein
LQDLKHFSKDRYEILDVPCEMLASKDGLQAIQYHTSHIHLIIVVTQAPPNLSHSRGSHMPSEFPETFLLPVAEIPPLDVRPDQDGTAGLVFEMRS